MLRVSLAVGSFLALAFFLGASEPPAAAKDKLPPPAPAMMDYARDIAPILGRACLSCHGPQKQSAGLRLDDAVSALKGGNSGAVILPGKSAESRLVHLIAGIDPELKMPPKGERLTTEEIGRSGPGSIRAPRAHPSARRPRSRGRTTGPSSRLAPSIRRGMKLTAGAAQPLMRLSSPGCVPRSWSLHPMRTGARCFAGSILI